MGILSKRRTPLLYLLRKRVDRASIHDRLAETNRRKPVGHGEGDLITFHRTRLILVLNERKIRYVIAAKLSGKTAAETAGAIMDTFLSHNRMPRKCIGFKTSAQALLKELGVDVDYTDQLS